jgi:hypothetical protein
MTVNYFSEGDPCVMANAVRLPARRAMRRAGIVASYLSVQEIAR